MRLAAAAVAAGSAKSATSAASSKASGSVHGQILLLETGDGGTVARLFERHVKAPTRTFTVHAVRTRLTTVLVAGRCSGWASGSALSLLTRRIADWFVMTDELLYERLALSVDRSHSLLPEGAHRGDRERQPALSAGDRPGVPSRRSPARLPRGSRPERVRDDVDAVSRVRARETRDAELTGFRTSSRSRAWSSPG